MVRDRLLELEHRFWEAGGDAEVYRTHFAEDGTAVFGFGVLDKTRTVASIEAADPWVRHELSGVTVTRISDGVAALSYTATAARADGEPYRAVVSSVYADRGDGWRLVLHQQTPTAEPGDSSG